MKKVSLLLSRSAAKACKTVAALGMFIGAGGILSTVYAATPQQYDQAKRIHERLTGVPPTQTDLDAMAALIEANDAAGAARYAVETSERRGEFYTTRLKNFFVQYTNLEDSMLPPLNDAAATMIGMVRDGVPFDQVLYGDVLYVPASSFGAYSRTDNSAYENLEQAHADLSSSANLAATTQSGTSPVRGSGAKHAGVTTTRAWGEAYYSAGTNRRVWRGISMNFLCRDLEEVKDTTGVPDRIRQDVSRSPGGDSSIFLNSCIGCHIGMDPLTGAFAYYEWLDNDPDDLFNGELVYNSTIVHNPQADPPVKHKYLINAGSFPEGYITRDDNWVNYWRQGKNKELGWGVHQISNPAIGGGQPPNVFTDPQGDNNGGNGPASLGQEVASSEAFAVCQVERVYKHVCLQDPISAHQAQLATIKDNFVAAGTFNMKNVFVETAALCKGQ